MVQSYGLVWVRLTPGDVLDRISILRIRERRVDYDCAARRAIEMQLKALEVACRTCVHSSSTIEQLICRLTAINEELWAAEDGVRQCREVADREGFVKYAEAILRLNDERSVVKGSINRLLGAGYCEEKCYRTAGSRQ